MGMIEKMTDSNTTQRMSVLIADDHQLIREMVEMYLKSQPDITVSLADNLASTLEACEEAGGFDVVMLDLAMPGMAGLAGVEKVIAANGKKPVVLFSGNASRDTVNQAINLGAKGYNPKTLPAKSLTNAIRFVAAGEVFLPMSYLMDDDPTPEQQGWNLSAQETRVLKKLCEGKTNKEIAREMELSEVTIKMYMRSICSRLGAKNRTHAAMIANQHSLV